MVVWLYQGTGTGATKKALVDPIAFLGGVRTPINEIWAYGTNTRNLVWSRLPMTTKATPIGWSAVKVEWSPPGAGADSFKLWRGGVLLYSGVNLNFTEQGLFPDTRYVYTVETIRAGAVVATQYPEATTATRTLSLSVTGFTYSAVALKWVDSLPAGLTDYQVKRGGVVVATVPATQSTYTDTGLTYNNLYKFTVQGVRSGVPIDPVSNEVSQQLTARPPMTVSSDAAALKWDSIKILWTDPAGDAHHYVLQRGSTVIANSTNTNGQLRGFTDHMLWPSTAYSYTLTARDINDNVLGTAATLSNVTTKARALMSLTAGHDDWWDRIRVSFSDSNTSSNGAKVIYGVYADAAEWAWNTTTASGTYDHIVGSGSGHNYTLYAYREATPGAQNWELLPVSAATSDTTRGRKQLKSFWDGNPVETATYNQDGTKRTDTSNMYYGRWDSTRGLQKSNARWAIPSWLRKATAGVISLAEIELHWPNLHTANNPPDNGDVSMHIHHYSSGIGNGSSGLLKDGGTTVKWPCTRGGNINLTEWFYVHWLTAPASINGREWSVSSEIWEGGACGFGLGAPTTSVDQYGYAVNNPTLRIHYWYWEGGSLFDESDEWEVTGNGDEDFRRPRAT